MTRDTQWFYLLAVPLALLLVTRTGSSADTGPADYVCTRDGTTRSIAVVQEPGYACRVKYTRPSGTTYPWNARHEVDYCRPKALGLAEKLGTLGWTCELLDDVKSVLLAQIERYGRYIRILHNVGKTCHFYPGTAQYGNLCGDGYAEAVLVYTCDVDADTWEQHLAVFIDTEDQPLIREVGSSSSQQVTGYFIDDNRLIMESERFEPDGSASSDGSTTTTSIRCRYDSADRWQLTESQ